MEFLLKSAIFLSFCVFSHCQFDFVFPTFQQFPNQPYQQPPMRHQPSNEPYRNSPNIQPSWQPSYQPMSRQLTSQPCQQGSTFGYPYNPYYNPNPCSMQSDNSQQHDRDQLWNTRTRPTTAIRTTRRPITATSTGRISARSKISAFKCHRKYFNNP